MDNHNNRQTVPCDNCTLCCQGDAVRLLPGDDPGLYITEPHPMHPEEIVLAHKENGDCIYLERGKGCTIHAHRPIMCGTMDCRNVYKGLPADTANTLLRIGALNEAVYNRGKELSELKEAGD